LYNGFHVKFTFKLENAGKKAVELNVGKYTKISESVPLLNLNMRRPRSLVSGTVLTQATAVVSCFACVAVAFLLGLGFVFAGDDGSATIGVIMNYA
jgi:hypothetical protein